MAQEIAGLTDAASTTKFKRDINTGGALLQNQLERRYNRKRLTTNLVQGQQYYQLSEDALRVSVVIAQSSGSTTWRPPMEEIPDEYTWSRFNQVPITGVPRYFFVRGFDEIGLYPTPSASITDGLEIWIEPKYNSCSQDDYTTGTVTVTNGSQTITHSATGFTQSMVGRWFTVTDGTDVNWYKISAFNSTSSLSIENYYQGISGSAKAFRIGEVMDIPEEFLEAPVDYAMSRHYKRRREINVAADFKQSFDDALKSAKNKYGKTTSQNLIPSSRTLKTYNPLIDTPIRPAAWS